MDSGGSWPPAGGPGRGRLWLLWGRRRLGTQPPEVSTFPAFQGALLCAAQRGGAGGPGRSAYSPSPGAASLHLHVPVLQNEGPRKAQRLGTDAH